MDLTQSQDLKIYLFVGHPMMPPVVEAMTGTLAFTLEQAQANLVESRKGNPPLMFTFCGTYPVQAILDKIEKKEPPQAFEFKTKESFVNGLKLVVDKYVEDPKEAKKLEKIINHLEKTYVSSNDEF